MPLTIRIRQAMLDSIKAAYEKLDKYNPESLAHVTEARFILWRLETTLTSNAHPHEIELKRLLEERWWMIKNSNLQYLQDFANPANEACVIIAQILAEFEGKSYLEILMPDLCRTPAEEYLTSSYTEDDIDLKALILSDRSSHIIHVVDVLESSQDDGVLKCNYLVDKKITTLSPSEQQRLLSRHPSIRAVFDALQARVKFKFDGDTVGSAVKRLIKGLRDGGKAKGGSEHDSGVDANVAIFEFNEYRDTLAPETLEALDGAGKFDRFFTHKPELLTFLKMWTYLKEPTFEMDGRQGPRYCVEMVANKIEELLDANPELYTLCSYQGVGEKQLSDLNFAVVGAMEQMKAALPLLEYHYCYPDMPSEALCIALSENSKKFRLNTDEVAYFFEKYIEYGAKNLNLNKLVCSICRRQEVVAKFALSYLHSDKQAIIQRDFNLLTPPVSQISLFKHDRKRDASYLEEDDVRDGKRPRSSRYGSAKY